MAPLVSTSILRRPPDMRSTLAANLVSSVMCGVPAGLALCSFQRCLPPACAEATVGASAAPAAIPAPADFRNLRRCMAAPPLWFWELLRPEDQVRQVQDDLRE